MLNTFMKKTTPLVALFVAACGGSAAMQGTPVATSSSPASPAAVADSCGITRPDFGGPATDADRKLFAYDASAPLNLQLTPQSSMNGVAVSAISFTSPDGGMVKGILADPVGRPGPHAGIILMAGMGPPPSVAGQARMLASTGAVVIAIDAPFHRRGGPLLRFTPQDRAEQIQLIKDLQRAVDVLRSRPNVDPARIGYIGNSFGGAMGALFVGVERRVKAAVLEVANGGLVSREFGAANSALSKLPCAARTAWIEAMAPIEPIRFISRAAPVALLMQNGKSDAVITKADAEALHKAASEPKTVWWYNAGHSLLPQAVMDKHTWLNGQIGTDRMKAPGGGRGGPPPAG